MKVGSPWTPAVRDIFRSRPLFCCQAQSHLITLRCYRHVLWICVECAAGNCVLLRSAQSMEGPLILKKSSTTGDSADMTLQSPEGVYNIRLEIISDSPLLLRCSTKLTPSAPLYIPFWPRDLVVANKDSRITLKGEIHVTQTGSRSGLQYFSIRKPATGSVFYFQNLTALNSYCETTHTSLADSVGGEWPELGFALPPATEMPLKKGEPMVLSDVFLAFDKKNSRDIFYHAKNYMALLAGVYNHLPKPDTEYHNWPDILENGLKDLQFGHACWSHANGSDYLNAYACDYTTPPEIMVQLAVLIPLLDYYKWSRKRLPAIAKIKEGLNAFFDDDIHSLVRWLPSQADRLDGSEEQLHADVMDSWYLHHPLLNLARVALQGDNNAKKLFFSSLPFAIKVAHHFHYNWPVFYNIRTLETIKSETTPGEGGEHDVAGLYAHVMLQAWKLSKEKKYLTEAKKAAKTLANKGFKLFYQANNTAFSAHAMLLLFKETGDELFLNLAYLCLANIFKNVHLWECDFGHAKSYSTFFGIYPLNDAPYTAAYEEQEVFATFHQFLQDAGNINLVPSVSLLLAESIRYLVHRAFYYYPTNLPRSVLSETVKTGEVDRRLWIALEDIHDGWEASGSVGQEVYGAGVAFGIVPRHYHRVQGQQFMIYIDYPTGRFRREGEKCLIFKTKGDSKMNCRMRIIPINKVLPEFEVTARVKKTRETVSGKMTREGHLEYILSGNTHVRLTWKAR